MNSVIYGKIKFEEIMINSYERAKRLSIAGDFDMKEFDICFNRLKPVVDCKYSAVKVPVNIFDENTLDCGFGQFKSENIIKNLKDSREVFVFGVTLGIGVDRLLNKLSAVSMSEYFITDALSSALAEGAMDKAEELVKDKLPTRPRFSPGFGDFLIENQPNILKLINAERLLGITVNKSYLMSPKKSVTAIMGIKVNDSEE